jgi:hypothetical protein
MTRGYLIFAVEHIKSNYVTLAYACALSIKLTQPIGYNNVTVVTNRPESFTGHKVFDNIIEYQGPEGMDARSRAYDYSPYDETVLLDSDMLFLKPMDHYWNMMNNRDLFISSAPQTYKGKRFHYGYYRRVMERNKWPDIYTAWTYFKKSNVAQEFFDLAKTITDNPTPYINMFLSDTLYKNIPTDEAFALALCMLDLCELAVPPWPFPRITHMKPAVQNWSESIPDWTDKLRFSITKNIEIKLGVWSQSDLLHYVKKDIISSDVITLLEKQYDQLLSDL